MYNLLADKIRIPLFFAEFPHSLIFLSPKLIAKISVFLIIIFSLLFTWYLGEIYYTFKLGYEIRGKELMVKNLEIEYKKNNTALISKSSSEAILQSQIVKSMLDVSSLKYLQSKNYFVEVRKDIP